MPCQQHLVFKVPQPFLPLSWPFTWEVNASFTAWGEWPVEVEGVELQVCNCTLPFYRQARSIWSLTGKVVVIAVTVNYSIYMVLCILVKSYHWNGLKWNYIYHNEASPLQHANWGASGLKRWRHNWASEGSERVQVSLPLVAAWLTSYHPSL